MKKIFLLATILFSFNFIYAQNKVTLTTLDWPPYIGSEMNNDGYVAQLVKEAFKRGGYSLNYGYYPWARVIALAESGQADGYFPEYYDESLKEKYYVSDPFPGGPLGFMARKDSNIKFSKLTDLKPFRIGVVRGYVNTAEFDSAAYLTKDEGNDDETNIRKLLEKRVDLIVIDKYVGFHILKSSFASRAGEIVFLETVLEEKDLYVCINKKVPNAGAIVAAFNRGLASMIKDGTVAKILKSNGF
ncbi:MAG: transporter substrate-binding domain-containing protein [Spirochaetales bacterium]|nr:transporter substrate-binding domain-containing protein [Spirochaetales bacterium]